VMRERTSGAPAASLSGTSGASSSNNNNNSGCVYGGDCNCQTPPSTGLEEAGQVRRGTVGF
jgi:hypothetical protein